MRPQTPRFRSPAPNRLAAAPMGLGFRIAMILLLVAASSLGVQDALAAGDITPDSASFDEALPEGGRLSGRELYERFLENRHRKSTQALRVVSTDAGGSAQTTNFTIRLEDMRDENDDASGGIIARMRVDVTHPFDMRHTSYLMIRKDPGPDDEFIYQPSQRRVRRVDLNKTPLMGTDYTFNDIVYHDLEDAQYSRLPDETIGGISVYVVEADVEDSLDTGYHHTISYLEKDHYVPLKIRYWDEFGVEVKRLRAPHAKIRAYGDVWLASETTMRDLLQGTESTLLIDNVELDPDFPSNMFSVSRLLRGR
jgi:hypothetical protein